MAQSNGGISLNQTRVIFLNEDKSQTITVKNTSKQNYLIQSRIKNEKGDVLNIPFVVTPPLFPLEAERNQLLRIFKQEESLPTDRESLFYLSVLAIPGQSESVLDKAHLSMGFQFILKLFYRPAKLQNIPRDNGCQLKFNRVANGIRIENPTPYFITFGSLKFDNDVIDLNTQASMIEPMGIQAYPVEQPIKHIEWQSITDVGGLSSLCQQAVSL
ncbi:molecular chaperone [Shewanella oncorhynchi]|uniref:Molecular chaperone n=1 Tax=Shewanella oncorhynchi TaxID=2726434 RepID=A0AA50Q1X2_9GAMM|nr:molecular chaperone [Shewanella oncorhynchi]WMB71229.1 molecular chaperone [Shewanella oncorhynchi]